jgi:hypothetical protein
MNYNEGCPVDIIPLHKYGTNSTMFTACCGTAICSDEKNCPKCGRIVVGANAKTDHERSVLRWKNATRYWTRDTGGR